jgi:hypothetical protein
VSTGVMVGPGPAHYVARKETSVGVTEARGKVEVASAPRTRYSSSSFSCCSCRRTRDSSSRVFWARSRSSESCLWVQKESGVTYWLWEQLQ